MVTPVALDRNPATVCLLRLALGRRRTMRRALNAIAELLTSGPANALCRNWPHLRYRHTAELQAPYDTDSGVTEHSRAICIPPPLCDTVYSINLMVEA